MERVFKLWRSETLTLEGKMIAFKTLTLSKIICYPLVWLKQFQQLLLSN